MRRHPKTASASRKKPSRTSGCSSWGGGLGESWKPFLCNIPMDGEGLPGWIGYRRESIVDSRNCNGFSIKRGLNLCGYENSSWLTSNVRKQFLLNYRNSTLKPVAAL